MVPSSTQLVNETSAGLRPAAMYYTDLNDRAMQHPLCTRNTSAYVGQTAKMYCCLARLDRELSVSNEDPTFSLIFTAVTMQQRNVRAFQMQCPALLVVEHTYF